ncbi:hypothetical protein OG285_32525 [Streptomyces sp. NBC_01471]|uniref:hypothetical protein n=1 Tax=Streptomyces sp. NBC_01471 TaxID=2903879 RepID=UPI0032516B26
MSDTTKSYGTWCNRINQYSTSPDADVLNVINGGDSDWRELLENSGALALIRDEYRNAINAALPPSISLCGDEFIGPAYPDDDEFDGYATDKHGALDLAAVLEDIDLEPIVERNDPLTLESIGRHELKSQSKTPGKVASAAMARYGVKAFYHGPNPQSGRAQSYFLAGEVRAALEARLGQGKRTDRDAA